MLFFIIAGACVFSYFLTMAIRRHDAAALTFKMPAPAAGHESARNAKHAKRERIVYPYSVIPGGVRSREDLAAAIRNDPIIAAHYSGFDVSRARIIKAEETKFVHVSYRLRDNIYWTAKTVRLSKGEALITDGKEVARTRCGNKVSSAPEDPVSEEEPIIETFDIAQFVLSDAPQFVTIRQPEMPLIPRAAMKLQPIEPYISAQLPSITPYYHRPLFLVQPGEVTAPEPGTFSLLAAGLAAIAAIRFRRKK
jgi:hypothetical protein